MKRNMKPLFMLTLLAIVLGFAACQDDSPTPYQPEFEENALPANDSIAYKTTMNLKWNATDKNNDELLYAVKVGTSATDMSEVATDLTEPTYTLKDLAVGEYYWQVTADDGNGGVVMSPVWNFTIIEKPVAPEVGAITFELITTTSATLNATVLNNGGNEIIERGIYWNTTGNTPYAGDGTKVAVEGKVGVFSCELNDLEQVRYYVMAYATNEFGTTYSEPLVFIPHDYVYVEGGTFTMGVDGQAYPFDNEGPAHSVTLSNYHIGKYEVTIKQYINFLNAIGCDADGTFTDDEYGLVPYIKMSEIACPVQHNGTSFEFNPSTHYTDENSSIGYVYWYGANAYAKWLGGALPTEAQWEYAAKGGAQSKGYTYSGGNVLAEVAWNYDNAPDATATKQKVIQNGGQLKANELGIYDMTGNVDEWCNDWYKSDYYAVSPAEDPQGPAEAEADISLRGSVLKVLRGGHSEGLVYDSEPEGNYTVTYRNKKAVSNNGDKSAAFANYRHGFRVVY